MAVNLGGSTDSEPPSSYATAAESLKVPRTPLESRQGYHPKSEDRLKWTTPPSRQLSRQRRVEYESDVRERFYDDYLGDRAVGDAGNEVLTTSELAKLKYDPSVYRINAYQGLAYDPMRPVPAGLDLNVVLEQQKMKERHRQVQEHRQRRLSEPAVGSRTIGYYPSKHYPQADAYQQPSRTGGIILPPIQQQRPRSALHQNMDEVIAPEAAPAIEEWLLNASKKDQEVAADFFRTLSSHGQRPDPASKAALHRSRVRSAVMTPVRKQRADAMATQSTFQQMSRDVSMSEKQEKSVRQAEPPARHRQLRRSSSEKGGTAKGSMFTAKKQMPSHFTIHPDWTSEATGQPKRK